MKIAQKLVDNRWEYKNGIGIPSKNLADCDESINNSLIMRISLISIYKLN
jgi:hypothetical protein